MANFLDTNLYQYLKSVEPKYTNYNWFELSAVARYIHQADSQGMKFKYDMSAEKLRWCEVAQHQYLYALLSASPEFW